MKNKKRLSKRGKSILLILSGSLLSTTVLACSLFALNNINVDGEGYSNSFKIFAFFAFLALSLSRAPMIFTNKRSKINVLKHIAFSLIYLTLAIISLILPVSLMEYCIFGFVFSLTIVANRILRIFEKKKTARLIVCNVILAVLAGILALVFLSGMFSGLPANIFILILFITFIVLSLIEVLFFCFSRIQLGAIMRVVRKTYALEILYGLVLLIVSSSFMFYIFEDGITSYGDALWYSFAIVTTIGFGDIVALGLVGRILSVILGLYGLVVVAVLTSIIVNLYNESNKKDFHKKDIDEIIDDTGDDISDSDHQK